MTTQRDPHLILCRGCAGTGFDLNTSQHVRCETCGGAGIVNSIDTPNDPAMADARRVYACHC
jgi:DnaJ-class molecular chaperone